MDSIKIILTGTTRIVVTLKKVVVKIPNFRTWHSFIQGLWCNMNEANTWRWNSGKYEQGKSHLLCPVVWASWGGWILVMKKVDRLLNDMSREERELLDFTEHEKHFPGDDSRSNYGILNNKLVKIDYAQ